jgi:hypothetical protein
MKNLNGWSSEQEAAYHEERKNKCEYCEPENSETLEWLENLTAQEVVIAAYRQHGISPKIIYQEYFEELSRSPRVEEIEVFMQELAS